MRPFDRDYVTVAAKAKTRAQSAAKSGTATAVINEIAGIKNAYEEELNNLCGECSLGIKANQKFRSEFVDPEPDRIIRQNATATDSKLEQRRLTIEQDRDQLLEDRRTTFIDLNTFKHDNELIRDAKEAHSALWHWAIFSFVWLVETILNGWFFGQTNNLGIMGGVMQAGMLSAVNMLLAAAIGQAFKYTNHIKPTYNFVGWGGLILGSIGLVLWNCLIGLYRDALELVMREGSGLVFEDAPSKAIELFKAGPFNVTEFQSVLLICLGILLAIMALLKQYYYGDLYPGYSNETDTFKKSRDELMEFRVEVESPSLGLIFDDSEDRLKDRSVQLKVGLDQFRSSITTELAEKEKLNAEFERARNDFKATLIQFKSSFQAMSASELPPEINIDQLALELSPTVPMPETDTDDALNRAEQLEDVLEDFQKKYEKEVVKISRQREMKTSELSSLWEQQDNLIRLGGAAQT